MCIKICGNWADPGPKTTSGRVCLLVIFLMGLAWIGQAASAATYYLDAIGGNDAAEGSASAPWRTLDRAKAEIKSGDTVKMYSGNYGSIEFRNYSFDSWVTFEAVENETPEINKVVFLRTTDVADIYLRLRKLRFRQGSSTDSTVELTRVGNVEILDCEFLGGGYSVDETYWQVTNEPSAVKLQRGTHDVIIKRCAISGTGSGWNGRVSTGGQDGALYGKGFVAGIWYADASSGKSITIEDCTITHCDVGISISGSNLSIVNNKVSYITSDGIVIGGASDNVVIRKNQIHKLAHFKHSDGTEISGHNDCLQFYGVVGANWQDYTNVRIENNTIYDCDQQGIFARVGAGSANWMVQNNLIYNIPYNGIETSHAARFFSINPIELRNNTIAGALLFHSEKGTVHVTAYNNAVRMLDFGTEEGVVVDAEACNLVGSFHVHMDDHPPGLGTAEIGYPAFEELFADSSDGNYRLIGNSMAIDYCPLGQSTPFDLIGKARIDLQHLGKDGSDYADVGCYEYWGPVMEEIEDRDVAENELVTFTVHATDPNNAPITYSAENLPTGASFSGQTFSWTTNRCLSDNVCGQQWSRL